MGPDTVLLNQQIAEMQLRLDALKKPIEPVQGIPADVLETSIRKVLGEMLPTAQSVSVPATQPADLGASFIQAVGLALNETQKQWLSDHRGDVPGFLSTYEGQAVTRRFFSMFETYKRQ